MIVCGVTYDEFWNGDPKICFFKEEAYEIRERCRLERYDGLAWFIGIYVANAISTCFADKKHPHEYPSYPKLVETLDESLKKKRKLAELTKMRDQFLAVSKVLARKGDGEPR